MFFHIIPKNIPKNAQKLHTDSNADRKSIQDTWIFDFPSYRKTYIFSYHFPIKIPL